jgi:hypothetical protein
MAHTHIEGMRIERLYRTYGKPGFSRSVSRNTTWNVGHRVTNLLNRSRFLHYGTVETDNRRRDDSASFFR